MCTRTDFNSIAKMRSMKAEDTESNSPIVIKSLDYLNLQVPNNYPTSSLILGRFYLSAFDSYQCFIQLHKDRNNIENMYNLEKVPITSEMWVYIRHIRRSLRLPVNELEILLMKSTPVELYLWTGDLFDELYVTVSKAYDKTKKMRSALRAIQRSKYCQYLSPFRLLHEMERYLKLIETFKEASDIVVMLLKLFFKDDIDNQMKNNLGLMPMPKLKFIVDIFQREKIYYLWPHQEYLTEFQLMDFYIEDEPERFIYLMKLGKPPEVDTFQKELILNLNTVEPIREQKLNRICRCLQVNLIYTMYEKFGEIYSNVLEYLWISLSEPFLSTSDFYETSLTLTFYSDELCRNDMHEWYKGTLVLPEDVPRTPRSLKHLTRCTARQSLALHLQFPNLIENSQFPKSLYQYLNFSCLKDNK